MNLEYYCSKYMDHACEQADLKTVESLLSSGYNVNEDALHEPPLVLASYYGHSELLEYLIQKGADVNARGDEEYTALHLASEAGDTQMVKILLDAGAKINTRSNNGITPLHETSDLRTVKYLLSNGAKICKDHDELTPFDHNYGCYGMLEDIEIGRYLVFYGDRPNYKARCMYPKLAKQCTLKDLEGSNSFLGKLIYSVLV